MEADGGRAEGLPVLRERDSACLFTVGLPVHNAMPYLPETVESLLGQTLAEFRVLAIVDGGTDGSLEYLRSIQDERFTVLEQEQHGITYTLNRMLELCETPWLVRQDADDVSAPERLAAVAQAVSAHPDAGMFYSNVAYYPARKSVGLFRCTRGTPEEIRELTRSGYVPAICHPSAVLNVEKMRSLGGYRQGLACEDADLWWRMALAYDIHFLPEVLLYFRQNSSSLTSNNLRRQALHGLYVQYMLLSQLEGRRPKPLPEVEGELDSMLGKTGLGAKQDLRLFNIYMGQGRKLRALASLAHAAFASPGYLFGRLRDEWFPPKWIANGLRPALYHQRKDVLWPQNLS